MARRTQVFQQLPWAGGVNTAVDPGLIPSTDLQQADNILFSSSGARIKREGFDYWDVLSDIPAVTYASCTSSGSIRTLVFAGVVSSGSIDQLVPGELIAVTSTDTKYLETSVTVAAIASDKLSISYVATSGTHALAPTAAVTVTRASPIVLLKDYWRFTGSVNSQLVMASTAQGQLFKYDSSGRRKEVLPNFVTVTPETITNRASAGTTRTLTFSGAPTGLATNDYVRITSTAAVDSYYTTQSAQITVSGSTITYTMAEALTETTAASTTLTVSELTTATVRTSTASKQTSIVFNEHLIVAYSGINNTPIKYKPETDADWLNLGGSPPDFSICTAFLNRVWCNDKANPDRLHYSATGSAELWKGAEDSGALDIRPGDGDSVGITGIYVFKGRVFVAKKAKMYQVVGDSPENFQVLDVSSGLGAEGHACGVAVDQDDFLYVSSKGIHSLATTAAYSDFASTYLSSKIQPTFNDFERARLANTQATYCQPINSVAFSISESDANAADTVWLYSVQQKEWYRWPEVDPQALATVSLSSTPTLMWGTSDGRLVSTQNGDYTDFGTTGIRYRIKSGTIYPDNSPMSLKAFKRVTIFFRPVGTYSATVKVKIDNYAEQPKVFSQVSEGDLLGSTFILGTSLLGSSSQFAPFTLPIDGYGRGCTIEIEQTGTEQQLAVYGYAIEWAPADISQETITDV